MQTREEKLAYLRAWQEKNKEVLKAKAKAKRDARTDEEKAAMKAYLAAYCLANKEVLREKAKVKTRKQQKEKTPEEREANRVARNAASRKSYEANKDKVKAQRSDGVYKARQKAYMNVYYAKNREVLNAQCRAWYAANPDKISTYRDTNKDKINKWQRDYRKTNDQVAAKQKVKREANIEAIREKERAFYEANKERLLAADRAWSAANKDKVAAKTRNRKARKRKAEGVFTASDVASLFNRQEGQCANPYCRIMFCDEIRYTVDHIVALAAGGSNWPYNLQLLCLSCNSSKQTLPWNKFLERQQRKHTGNLQCYEPSLN